MMEKIIIGRCERVGLPALGIPMIEAKVDTGAKTCCLHAFVIEPFTKNDEIWVRFSMHPHRANTKTILDCEARVIDRRDVTDSGGKSELRYVIETDIVIGNETYTEQINLSDRENLRFRMLLGRNLLRDRFLVDTGLHFYTGYPSSLPEEERKRIKQRKRQAKK